MPTIAETLVTSLADLGVRTIWGVVGDALNPITDAIRREDRLEWIGVRHEEVGAFAAGAQSQLSGTIGVCMGTVGPGSVHLLNGLYDAKKSHAPVLAICGQVHTSEIASNYFQEVDNDLLFRDVAVYTSTVTSSAQMPYALEQAVNTALARAGVAVLTIPGDLGAEELPSDAPTPRFVCPGAVTVPGDDDIRAAADMLGRAKKVTLLVGAGARTARGEVLDVASILQAPMVLTLKAKETLEDENPYAVGQTGLIGNPAAHAALEACEVLLLIGTDFPYRQWYPQGKKVIQLDTRAEHIGRRTPVDLALIGQCRPAFIDDLKSRYEFIDLQSFLDLYFDAYRCDDIVIEAFESGRSSGARALLAALTPHSDSKHLTTARKEYQSWRTAQSRLADPDHDRTLLGRLRRHADNPQARIRPEALAAALDRHAADDTIFTSDTGMSTVWLSRFITMSGRRRLLGSYNHGLHGQRFAPVAGRSGTRPRSTSGRCQRRRKTDDAACGPR